MKDRALGSRRDARMQSLSDKTDTCMAAALRTTVPLPCGPFTITANLAPDALLTVSGDFWFVLGGVLRF
jgi:hypothetical protein